ncbi:MAG: hypothetical protein LLG04_04590 [Parachlamydia sp.]|nr:hypothetical protein [Parachlamydia sp.]
MEPPRGKRAAETDPDALRVEAGDTVAQVPPAASQRAHETALKIFTTVSSIDPVAHSQKLATVTQRAFLKDLRANLEKAKTADEKEKKSLLEAACKESCKTLDEFVVFWKLAVACHPCQVPLCLDKELIQSMCRLSLWRLRDDDPKAMELVDSLLKICLQDRIELDPYPDPASPEIKVVCLIAMLREGWIDAVGTYDVALADAFYEPFEVLILDHLENKIGLDLDSFVCKLPPEHLETLCPILVRMIYYMPNCSNVVAFGKITQILDANDFSAFNREELEDSIWDYFTKPDTHFSSDQLKDLCAAYFVGAFNGNSSKPERFEKYFSFLVRLGADFLKNENESLICKIFDWLDESGEFAAFLPRLQNYTAFFNILGPTQAGKQEAAGGHSDGDGDGAEANR